MITVAQSMVKALEKENISVVFGYPGAAICPFYDALSNSDIKHVLVRQEQNAVHSASGYARMTNKPAVCIATSGPGALNLITGIATAYMDSIPVVVITGQVSRDLLGRDVFQEADITGAVEPFSKYSYIVKDPKDIGRVFKEAFYLANTGRKGPVIIDIPVDVQREKIDFSYPESISMRSYKPNVNGHPGQIKRAISALKSAKKPLILAGGGIFSSDSSDLLLEFSQKSGIPVITTMMGIGAVHKDYDLNFGMLGMHGVACANFAIRQADVLLAIGTRAGDRAVASPKTVKENKKVIHIDIDPAEIGKNLSVDIPVVGDAKLVLNELIEKIPSLETKPWIEEIENAKKCPKENTFDGFINPKDFLRKLSEKAEKTVTVVADVGQNQIWTANNFNYKSGRYLTSGGMGTMGYSIPAGVGAKLACPENQVITVCGDGSFQMQMMELGTIAQNKIPLKMVVFTNGRLGMVRELQTNLYADNQTAVFLDGSPDIAKLVSAYGIKSRAINGNDDIDSAIDEFLAYDGTYLLECYVSPSETTL